MPKDDLRIHLKQERTVRNSIENFKLFVTNYQENRDRRSVEMRIEKLDEI